MLDHPFPHLLYRNKLFTNNHISTCANNAPGRRYLIPSWGKFHNNNISIANPSLKLLCLVSRSTLHTLAHSFLTMTFTDYYYHLCFTKGETEVWKVKKPVQRHTASIGLIWSEWNCRYGSPRASSILWEPWSWKVIWTKKIEAKKKQSEEPLVTDENEAELKRHLKIPVKSYEMLNDSNSQNIVLSKLHRETEKKFRADIC